MDSYMYTVFITLMAYTMLLVIANMYYDHRKNKAERRKVQARRDWEHTRNRAAATRWTDGNRPSGIKY